MLRWTGRLLRRLPGYMLLLVLLLFGLQRSTIPLELPWNAVSVIVKDHTFDYVTWEINALAAKFDQTLYGLHPFMSEAERSQYVRDYMADLARAQQLEAQVTAIYTDPTVTDPLEQSAELRAERDALRVDLVQRQGLAEAILEGQVAAVLIDEGFGTLGQLLPPLSMRFTRLPNLLAVSQRDAISLEIYINIDPLPVDEVAALEQRIDADVDVASLVVPLGGIALYPAMIAETTSIPFAADTFAHEWLHHYLFAFPLGLAYDFTGEARIINETTANLFGNAIGPQVIARYYPDLAQRSAAYTWVSQTGQDDAPFDFGREMDQTRRRVDELLAAGEVEEAEAYMEARRRLFVENGYGIRRLNQAYFAFYGGYQAGGGIPGAGGADPIGPAVQEIFDRSASLHDFVVTMRGITTREELQAAVETVRLVDR
ncbi:MAG: hypothetical protein CL610_01230 [Anaerolineaceae bacterium]|nr:hypothetical protein [Anaerolineaceae bacterium]